MYSCNILTRYYEGDRADDKHQKGVLYLDHSSVSVTIDKGHNELQISNASKGSHHGFHHVVQDLMMHFSSLPELEKWHAALTNCLLQRWHEAAAMMELHPQPQPVKQDAAAAPRHETRKVKINIVYYSTYALLIDDHLRPALHTDSRLHLCLSYGHITKMAEAMAAAITVRFTPLNSSSSSVLFAPIFSPVSFTPPQASGNDAAIFQVLHTAPPQPATIAAQRVQAAARNPKPVMFLAGARDSACFRT